MNESKHIKKPITKNSHKKPISKDTFIKAHERKTRGYIKKSKKG